MTQLVRVVRTRPGVGFTEINGVAFAPSATSDALISEPIAREEAERLFLACPGYATIDVPDPPSSPPMSTPKPAVRRSRGATP